MSTLFVGNLSPDVSEEDLRELFQAHGQVRSLRLITRRRMAFVELDPADADAALAALRGSQLRGRTLDVAMEGPSRGRPKGGGGRRRAGRR